MKRLRDKWLFSMIFFLFASSAHSINMGPWDLEKLYAVPKYEISNLAPVAGMKSILYHSLEYLGKPVQVFAYYSAPAGTPPMNGWPAVVYAHGGGGTAIPSWVTYWNSHGYACITMDLEGHIPTSDADGNRLSTPNPGPSRDGIFGDYEKPIPDQWYYHAIAQVILAHTLIASFPEVDATKIGVTGTSWGGTITSTVMGVDSRWAWAAPVYGTGYLSGSDGNQGQQLAKDNHKIAFVDTYYDGSVYFENVKFPTMWVTGTNDFHFPLTISQKSSQSVNGPATLLWALRFGHGNTTSQSLDQMYLFANQVVNGDPALIKFGKPTQYGNKVSARYTTDLSVSSAQLLYTYDKDSIWPNKFWYGTPATITSDSIFANIPVGACAVFLNASDSRGATVNTEYLEIPIKAESLSGDTVQIVPRNNTKFCIGADKNESVYLTDRILSNNLSWKEIDQGNGYYSYQLVNTNYCMHGGIESADGQDVYLWNCDSKDEDQLWLKVKADSGYYRLLKASNPEFALTIGSNNNLQLQTSDESNQLQYWKNISSSQLSFKVTDGSSIQNLAEVSISVAGQTLTTNSNGEASVRLGNGQNSISFTKKGYAPVSLNLDLVKDTMLHIALEKEKYNFTLKVSSFETAEVLSGVSLKINDSVYETDADGSISLMLEIGKYSFILGKEGYISLNKTISIETNTTISLQMKIFTCRLAFRIEDAITENGIPTTTIVLNDVVYETNPYGSRLFELRPENYTYKISKEGYSEVTGSISLEKDTTLVIAMSFITSVSNLNELGIEIYPNPASTILNIAGIDKVKSINYQIVNTLGSIVKEGVVTEHLDVTELNKGVYILFLQDDNRKPYHHIFMKQ